MPIILGQLNGTDDPRVLETSINVSIVNNPAPWLSRATLAALRDKGEMSFDATTLNGARHRLTHVVPPGNPAVPINNDEAIEAMHGSGMLQTQFSVSGSSMSAALASFYLELHESHQDLWRQKAELEAKLSDEDISYDMYDELLGALEKLKEAIADAQVIPLDITGGFSATVMFAPGDSCKLTDWVIAGYYDFSFELLQEESFTIS